MYDFILFLYFQRESMGNFARPGVWSSHYTRMFLLARLTSRVDRCALYRTNDFSM